MRIYSCQLTNDNVKEIAERIRRFGRSRSFTFTLMTIRENEQTTAIYESIKLNESAGDKGVSLETGYIVVETTGSFGKIMLPIGDQRNMVDYIQTEKSLTVTTTTVDDTFVHSSIDLE